MYTIALCDDSKADIAVLTEYLKMIQEEYNFECVTFLDGTTLVESYNKGKRYDLIILDMCMEILDGIDTAKLIRKIDDNVPIIIVTATVQYAVDGYKVNASRYIVKPVDKTEFLNTVKEKLKSIAEKKNQFFNFTSNLGTTKVKLQDIYYFESDMRTIYIHLKKETFSFTGKISQIEEQLKDCGFFRVHKSFVINLYHTYNIFKDYVSMDNGEKVPVSKYKHKEVSEKLLEYMENDI